MKTVSERTFTHCTLCESAGPQCSQFILHKSSHVSIFQRPPGYSGVPDLPCEQHKVALPLVLNIEQRLIYERIDVQRALTRPICGVTPYFVF